MIQWKIRQNMLIRCHFFPHLFMTYTLTDIWWSCIYGGKSIGQKPAKSTSSLVQANVKTFFTA